MSKKQERLRRGKKTRQLIRQLGAERLTVHRTPRHIYAQIFSSDGSRVLAAASTIEKSIKESIETTGNIAAAAVIGKAIAERALAAGVSKVAFDRSGFKYHGRVRALADAAREAGLTI
ncbi:MAG: 50S ribosomal protein L18 [Methylococcaceae bacterium]|nr:50S ribosomal protein L18 [Methylococcaceae bacterium]